MSKKDFSSIYLAQNLRYLRKRLKLSQEKLSVDLGITRNKIASYESRNIEPKLDLVSKIADYFQLRIDDLLKTAITEENYNALVSSRDSIVDNRENALEILLDLKNKTAISEFINTNEKIGKIISGFKAYQEIRNENDEETKEIAQLLEVLDYLLETNKNLILEINSTNIK